MPEGTHLVGAYNSENIQAALCVGEYFGVEREAGLAAIRAYVPTNNRSQLSRTASNLVIEDAYNANPSSMAVALDNLAGMAGRKVALLAWYRLGRGDRSTVFECLENAHEVLTTETAALMMSDVYMQLGMVAMAQRAAFEGMVNVSDMRLNERALRRLTETALVMGQYEVALKYLSIIDENYSSSDWVQQMRPMALHPELIRQHPVFNKLREEYEKTKDQFFM